MTIKACKAQARESEMARNNGGEENAETSKCSFGASERENQMKLIKQKKKKMVRRGRRRNQRKHERNIK